VVSSFTKERKIIDRGVPTTGRGGGGKEGGGEEIPPTFGNFGRTFIKKFLKFSKTSSTLHPPIFVTSEQP